MAKKKEVKKVRQERAADEAGRQKALQKAIEEIEKEFGKGALMRLGDKANTKIDSISSGSLLIDSALGIGGYPRGRIVEIYGPESSGKTTTALHAVAEVQKAGGIAAYIDVEHALDPVYAQNLGIKVEDLFLSQPDSGEEALEIAEALVRSGAIDLIVVDSVAALVPQAEIQGNMGDSHVGLQARLMSQALRKLSGHISKQNTVAIFINQLREKVGVTYGNPEVTPGGRALKYYSTIRMEVRKGSPIREGGDSSPIIGSETKIKIVKNKVAPPFKTVVVDIVFGSGISKTGEILDLAVEYKIIKKAGAWFSYGDTRLGQGREKAKKYLLDHPDFMEDTEHLIRIKLGLVEPSEEDIEKYGLSPEDYGSAHLDMSDPEGDEEVAEDLDAEDTDELVTVSPDEDPLLAELLSDDDE